MFLALLLLLVLFKSSLSDILLQKLPQSLEDELYLTTPEIISKYGYPSETHHVTTEDGYILSIHRIPRNSTKGSVLIMHGIVASSADWILSGPDEALAYLLYNEGYDVWLGNVRGNRYCQKHTFLKPESKKFWDFSWHEMGIYDLPSIIDFIIDKTGEEKIFYIGHSQGNTIFYVMTSQKPEYNEKIKAQISMAPVAFVSHMFSPLFHMLAAGRIVLQGLVNVIDLNELLPNKGLISTLGQNVCGDNAITEMLCSNLLFAITGFNYKQLNKTMLPLILAHDPSGCSTKQLLHFAQEINSGHFRQYDYGFLRNLNEYSRFTAPDYDLSKITSKIYFFYSGNDWISSTIDVNNLGRKLKNLKGKFRVSDAGFNHIDYMFGINAKKLVYNKILSLMIRY